MHMGSGVPSGVGCAAPPFQRFWKTCLEVWVQDARWVQVPSASVQLRRHEIQSFTSPPAGRISLQEAVCPGGALERVGIEAEKP